VLVVCDRKDPRVAYLDAGFKATSERSAQSCASRLLQYADVRGRKAELEAEIANKTVQKRVDDCVEALDARTECLRDLRRARDLAFKQERAGEAAECVKKIAILEGVWIEQQAALVSTVSDLRAVDDERLLQAVFGAQQISALQRQGALSTLLDRRRQALAAPAVDVETNKRDTRALTCAKVSCGPMGLHTMSAGFCGPPFGYFSE
jgi:hypothetical protein